MPTLNLKNITIKKLEEAKNLLKNKESVTKKRKRLKS